MPDTAHCRGPHVGEVCHCGGYKYRYSFQCRKCSGSSRRDLVTYPPEREPLPVEVAYAAGFFEGEGSVGYYVSGSFRVTLPQKDREVLDWMRPYVGGRVRVGGQMCVLELNGALARRFIDLVEPYLSTRRLAQVVEARRREEFARA